MSTYVEKTLASGEKILKRAVFNWTYSLGPVIWATLSLVPVFVYLWLVFAMDVSSAELFYGWWFVGAAALSGVLVLVGHIVTLVTTEIVVTNYRFVHKVGLFNLRAKEVSLNQIEEISISQSLWGRMFNYGHIVMRGTGVGVIELSNIDGPITLRRIIEDARANLRAGHSEGEVSVDPGKGPRRASKPGRHDPAPAPRARKRDLKGLK